MLNAFILILAFSPPRAADASDMRLHALLATVATGAIASLPLLPAAAQSWLSVAEAGGNQAYIDLESWQRNEQYALWWQKIELASGQAAVQALSYVSTNCKSNLIQIREKIVYDRDGRVLEQEKLGNRAPLASPNPGSIQFSLLKAACAGENGQWQ